MAELIARRSGSGASVRRRRPEPPASRQQSVAPRTPCLPLYSSAAPLQGADIRADRTPRPPLSKHSRIGIDPHVFTRFAVITRPPDF
ncbi:hypothetical protein K1T71_001845 [Dendrolimus kikuchii]|uniref:Uncharacterized protein n=1 Tax=Dendrolimus kikuchii TaxID=765133 RepID=A0ACC1DGI8_9NEOP|nr:hypothetical protein K1T71_001845 [Dendrolimus kikuchii]